jgi:hypothetical protein
MREKIKSDYIYVGYFYQDGIDKYDGSSTSQIERTTRKKEHLILCQDAVFLRRLAT